MAEEEKDNNLSSEILDGYEQKIKETGDVPQQLALHNILHLRKNDPEYYKLLEYDCPKDLHIVNFYVQIMRNNPTFFGMEKFLTKSTTPLPSHVRFERLFTKAHSEMYGQEPVAEEVFEEMVEEQEAPSDSSGKTIVCLNGCVCGLHALYQPAEVTSALSLSSGIDSERLDNSFLDYDMMEKLTKNQNDMGDALIALQEDVKVLV